MPGGIWPDDAQKLIAVADLLGCSIDYLLGRTDCKEVNRGSPECVNLDTGWRTDNPAEPGWYAVLAGFDDEPDAPYTLQKAEWTGDRWEAHGTAFTDIGMTVVFWIPLPEE